jgi:LuxR family maltose regulon positive regulatory protein
MQGRTAESLARLAGSLAQAEPAGCVRIFIDEGSRLAPVLAALSSSVRHGEPTSVFTSRIVQYFRQETKPAAQDSVSFQDREIVHLTGRELDVLRDLIQGLSYPQIAAHLVISPGTVKTHASHIYAKLSAGGRMEAIRRARELKIE